MVVHVAPPSWLTPARNVRRDEAVAVLREILAGKGNQAMRDMVALNLGCALHLLEDDLSLKQGVAKAQDAIASGTAAKFFKDVLHA